MKKTIGLDFKKSTSSSTDSPSVLNTFNSYSFDRNIMIPASAFRFTAPGIDKDLRLSIRSSDMVQLFVIDGSGNTQTLATGYIDETDTHILPNQIEYVLTGRDTIGQLIDNSAIDANNRMINIEDVSLQTITNLLLLNTRIPSGWNPQQVPNSGKLLFQTNAGETKINALQRYLELMNCLIWSLPNGQVVVGKPNFTQKPFNTSLVVSILGSRSNVLEARVRRNVNQAIRKIAVQLQTLDKIDPAPYTKNNNDKDMLAVARTITGQESYVGRSVYETFTNGNGAERVNQLTQVGNQSGNPDSIGDSIALRQLAKDNMKILDVEIVVATHLNPDGVPYNIDQMYNVQIDDENLYEVLYVYAVTYELTMDHGAITRLRLCRPGTICAFADAVARN